LSDTKTHSKVLKIPKNILNSLSEAVSFMSDRWSRKKILEKKFPVKKSLNYTLKKSYGKEAFY